MKGKYEDVKCENYSDVISGYLKIKQLTKLSEAKVLTVDSSKCYLYNSDNESFELISQNAILTCNYYTLIKYANIPDEEYEKILKTKKSSDKKRQEILVRSKQINGSEILLLINNDNNIDTMPLFTDGDNSIRINDVSIDIILSNSKMSYYAQLLDSRKYLQEIFLSERKYTLLKTCDFDSLWHPHRYSLDNDNRDFFFYNKEILVDRFIGLSCLVPFSLEVIGYINYLGNYVKLDVSRNSIIQGFSELEWQMTLILLKYIKDNEKINDEVLSIINKMIEHLTRLSEHLE